MDYNKWAAQVWVLVKDSDKVRGALTAGQYEAGSPEELLFAVWGDAPKDTWRYGQAGVGGKRATPQQAARQALAGMWD